MVERVLVSEDEDWLEVVALACDLWLLLEHYFLEEGAGLSPDWRVLGSGAEGEAGVVDVSQVPDGLAEPSSVFRFVFFEEVVLAAHNHHVDGRNDDALGVLMRAILSLALAQPLAIFLPLKWITSCMPIFS